MATVNELTQKVSDLEEKVNVIRSSNSKLKDELLLTNENINNLVNDLNDRFENVRERLETFRN